MTFEALGDHRLACGRSELVMQSLPDDSIDAAVTDPPAGIGFQGCDWDKDKGGRDEWIAWLSGIMAECLRVVKPGGHALVWALPRTSHWTGTALENAGWEIRDCIDHLFWSGFPKSLNVSKSIDSAAGAVREVVGESSTRIQLIDHDSQSHGKWVAKIRTENGGVPVTAPATPEAKQWDGWGTALKPAHECWWLARKPLLGTVAANVLKYGTGALNIDGCRLRYGDPAWPGPQSVDLVRPAISRTDNAVFGAGLGVGQQHEPIGRWPANIYYTPKPSTQERETGCEGLAQHTAGELTGGRAEGSNGLDSPGAGSGRTSAGRGNTHPTTKSVKLMRWLCRLVTPPGGTVLDPFAGSGTTILACEAEGFRCTAVELDPHHCEIIRARHHAATRQIKLAL
jgi:site-specific DNA-methyltransferase (adenine-specific)